MANRLSAISFYVCSFSICYKVELPKLSLGLLNKQKAAQKKDAASILLAGQTCEIGFKQLWFLKKED